MAQGGHGAEYFLTQQLTDAIQFASERNTDGSFSLKLTKAMQEWIMTGHKKVVCQIPTEADLLALKEKAELAGIVTHLVTDSGLTEFGEPTNTVLALGPDWEDRLDPLTGHLKLY